MLIPVQNDKKLIVISAINLVEGGPLSILLDVIDELSKKDYYKYRIVFFINSISVIKNKSYSDNITFQEKPSSKKSYFIRFYYEYFFFYLYSQKKDIYLWISLHDMSPFVKSLKQVVYCHNPAPFRKIAWKELTYQKTYFLFTLFYKLVYRINIHANKYVVVQQQWLKKEFINEFKIEASKIIIASPNADLGTRTYKSQLHDDNKFSFFFPSLARPFKNFEVICKACQILQDKGIINYKVYLTINGTENKYSEEIFKKFNHLKVIDFIGLITREEVFDYYQEINVLIFPSKLETWGLPISEFKQFNKPVILVDSPYAYETLGNYQKVNFFNQDDAKILSQLMQAHIEKNIILGANESIIYTQPKVDSWEELFKILLE